MGNVGSIPKPPAASQSVSFTLNGQSVSVSGLSPSVTLNEWLRTQPGLTGTKRMCGEGGCGACVVTVRLPSHHGNDDKELVIPVNSVSANLFIYFSLVTLGRKILSVIEGVIQL